MSEDVGARLRAERSAVLERLAGLRGDRERFVEASRDSNADDEHDPEGATIAFERSQVNSLVERTRQHLAEVEAAERRLDEGAYGTCEVCGRPVGDERLEARPTARTCVNCARSSSR